MGDPKFLRIGAKPPLCVVSGWHDFPRRRFREDRRPCAPKLNPICPFPRHDTPGVAFPPRIPRQVAVGCPPACLSLSVRGYAGGLRGSMPPLWTYAADRLRSRAE